MVKETNLRLNTRLTLITIIVLSTAICLAQFGGGDGSEVNPYQIDTAEHLNAIRGQYLGSGIHFIQTADIYLDAAPWNQGQGWTPIGNSTQKFEGNFNGDGHYIVGLAINRNTTHQGLFGYTDGATIIGVRLKDVNVSAGRMVAALIGYTSNYTVVKNCNAEGTVKGSEYVAGIVGYALRVEIHNCFMNGSVEATTPEGRAGGIGGYMSWETSALNCYSTATVKGVRGRVGGLAGHMMNSEIRNSYCTGSVVAVDEVSNVGGLVGQLQPGAAVRNSLWNIETTGRDSSPGGGTGVGTTEMTRITTFQAEGWQFPDIWNIIDGETYPFLSWEDGPSFHNRLGPSNLVAQGNTEEMEIALNWNMNGNPNRYDIFRNNTHIGSVNHPVREHIDRNVVMYTEYIYQVKAVFIENNEERATPPSNPAVITLSPSFAGGDGTEDNPYQVASEAQLDMLRLVNNLSAHFIQTEHLDLHDTAWIPIGTNANRFRGTYNGNRFRIDGLTINNNSSNQGLFGYVDGATLNNITLVNVNVRFGQYSGALVGRAENTNISNVTIFGNIEGVGTNVGGLVGYTTPSAKTISNCSASGTLTSTSNYVGGLVGRGDVTINSCKTDLEITTAGCYAGGIIGAPVSSTLRITSCQVLGNITSTSTVDDLYLGGIVGQTALTHIENSFVTGNVTSAAEGGRDYVGGLIGAKTMTCRNISKCYVTGNVTGRNYVGGLVGAAHSPNTDASTNIEDSYVTGSVTGVNYVGGLIGSNRGKPVIHCYSIGRVQGETNVGGLIGSGDRETTNSYWNTISSGQEESPGGGLPRDNRQMVYPYNIDTYVNWNFNTVWTDDIAPSWNNGYPRLWYQEIPPPEAIETPQLKVDIIQIDEQDHFRIRWELIENANSYQIYASYDPMATNWGEPIHIVGSDITTYTEPIGNNIERYFYIIASIQEVR